MRQRLNFNLLRSQLLYTRGSRCTRQIFTNENEDVNLVVLESQTRWQDDMILQPRSLSQESED